jgi:chorismate mutase-like protein
VANAVVGGGTWAIVHVMQLDQLRAELDEIDARLLDTVSERIRCVERIADYKRRNAVPMMQPHRVAAKQQAAAAYAAANGLNEAFLARLYDLLVDEACQVENRIIDGT